MSVNNRDPGGGGGAAERKTSRRTAAAITWPHASRTHRLTDCGHEWRDPAAANDDFPRTPAHLRTEVTTSYDNTVQRCTINTVPIEYRQSNKHTQKRSRDVAHSNNTLQYSINIMYVMRARPYSVGYERICTFFYQILYRALFFTHRSRGLFRGSTTTSRT